jgi:hypothetical protein
VPVVYPRILVLMKQSDKVEQLKRWQEVVSSPLATGVTVSGSSLCDMYINLQDRHRVLDVLQQRYPHATEGLQTYDAAGWYDKITSAKGVTGYVSGFAGEVGEHAAIEYLARAGVRASQFGSRVHKGTDLLGDNGLEYSVKSYTADGMHNFLERVREHPTVENYIVNSELYDALQSRGVIDKLAEKGVSVINGNFEHEHATTAATKVLGALSPDGMGDIFDGVWDDLPIAGALIMLANVGVGVARYRTGAVSGSELRVDVVKALVRVGAGAGSAAGGAAVGAAIGSAVFPLVGTVIGGTAGGILASIGAGSALTSIADRWKWGRTLDVCRQLTNSYADGIPTHMQRLVADELLQKRGIDRYLAEEAPLAERFKLELDPSSPTPPSFAAVLWSTSLERAQRGAQRADEVSAQTHDVLMEAAITAGIAKYPRVRSSAHDHARLMFGACILESSVLRKALRPDELSDVRVALKELESRPNYPCKTLHSKDNVLRALLLSRV